MFFSHTNKQNTNRSSESNTHTHTNEIQIAREQPSPTPGSNPTDWRKGRKENTFDYHRTLTHQKGLSTYCADWKWRCTSTRVKGVGLEKYIFFETMKIPTTMESFQILILHFKCNLLFFFISVLGNWNCYAVYSMINYLFIYTFYWCSVFYVYVFILYYSQGFLRGLQGELPWFFFFHINLWFQMKKFSLLRDALIQGFYCIQTWNNNRIFVIYYEFKLIKLWLKRFLIWQ